MGDGNRLYICGTNAHNPKDWVVYVSILFNFYFLATFLCTSFCLRIYFIVMNNLLMYNARSFEYEYKTCSKNVTKMLEYYQWNLCF